jgi:hypothetical protein
MLSQVRNIFTLSALSHFRTWPIKWLVERLEWCGKYILGVPHLKIQGEQMGTAFQIESFVGDAVVLAHDPYESAVKNATVQAQDWLDKHCDDDYRVEQVVSTQTHVLPTGDYVTCIITMVFKMAWSDEEEEENA